MVGKAFSAAISGVEAQLVEVEADIAAGIPSFDLTGNLGGTAKEARERVRTALRNSKIHLNPSRITVNMAPANVRKDGPHFDLAIAVAVLCAGGVVLQSAVKDTLIAGELGLDGDVNAVNATLPMIICAQEAGLRRCIVPESNATEGEFIAGIDVIGVKSLAECVEYLRGDRELLPVRVKNYETSSDTYDIDFGDIRGQRSLKRAVTVAAAGMHNLLMVGPPGSGKTMTAERIPTILPPLTYKQQMEVWRIYSVAGLWDSTATMGKRPFRAPHHTVTPSAMAGGGRSPMPGEMSLSQHGVLFLDELNLFGSQTVEVLRQPLENGYIRIDRVGKSIEYPADFMLVAAINPCRCGYYPDRRRCNCTPADIKQHFGHISRPIMDRIDICIQAPAIRYEDIEGGGHDKYDSSHMREMVGSAYERQKDRYAGCEFVFNSEIPAKEVNKYCTMESEAVQLMKKIYDSHGLSARSYYKILKVARTIADIDGNELITAANISEAVGYKTM